MLQVKTVPITSVLPHLLEGTWLLRLCDDPDVRRSIDRERSSPRYRWYITTSSSSWLLSSRVRPNDISFQLVSLELEDSLLAIRTIDEAASDVAAYYMKGVSCTIDDEASLVTIARADGRVLCQFLRAEYCESVSETMDELCAKVHAKEETRQLDQVNAHLLALVRDQPLVITPVIKPNAHPRFVGVMLKLPNGKEIVIESTSGGGISIDGLSLDQIGRDA